MPKHGEYWYCRERGLCVNCYRPSDDYVRCELCRAKHHQINTAFGAMNSIRRDATHIRGGGQGREVNATTRYRTIVKLGTKDGKRALARSDAAWRTAQKRSAKRAPESWEPVQHRKDLPIAERRRMVGMCPHCGAEDTGGKACTPCAINIKRRKKTAVVGERNRLRDAGICIQCRSADAQVVARSRCQACLDARAQRKQELRKGRK